MGKQFKIILASPRGFCAGVERAIEIVERALNLYGPPVYVRHEIVHNKHVVNSLRNMGAIFVEEIDDIPPGAHAIFSAHGVAASVVEAAAVRGLEILDATCPLVSKVHKEGQKHDSKGRQVILIGHAGHPEVEGTQGQINGGVLLVTKPEDVDELQVKDPEKLAYVTQTTLSVDETREVITALRTRFPSIIGPDLKDICYATQNRQDAVRELAPKVDLLLVVGAKYSSNSNRLCDLGASIGVESHLIASADDLVPTWLDNVKNIGITAGASAPEDLVQGVISRLGDFGEVEVTSLPGVEENITFKLPKKLLKSASAAA